MTEKSPYNPCRAWLRAFMYFAACFVIAWIAGVTQIILDEPLVSETQLSDSVWWIATGLVTTQVLFAYLCFWPRGTVSFGRSGHWLMTTLFGLLWGAAQGQLLIAFCVAIEMIGFGKLTTALVVIVIYSTWAGLWQSRFWDVYVSPEHNIPEWNTRKVLFAHVPFLILSVAHFMTFRNAGLLVIWQIIALTASTWAMRFPAPWEKGVEQ